MNGASVLVVDDVVENIRVLVDCLQREGFRVLIAQDGVSALDRARNGQPDAILLDVMLPGEDGFEICRRLKADPATQRIPVIFITALDDTQDKIKGFTNGGTDYLTKPFQYDEVVARVNTHVALRRSQIEIEDAKTQLETRVKERTAELERALIEVERLKEQLEAENAYLHTELNAGPRTIIGESAAIRALIANIGRVSA
ncbi:MAG: response regulator [Gammaproteobacteria bacterium]|nr:response regulator [Gammaproteobacteria bacterium]